MFFTDSDFFASLRITRAVLGCGLVVLFAFCGYKSRRFGNTPGMDYLRMMLWGMAIAEVFFVGFQMAATVYGPSSVARGYWQIAFTFGEIIRFVSVVPFMLFLLSIISSRYHLPAKKYKRRVTDWGEDVGEVRP